MIAGGCVAKDKRPAPVPDKPNDEPDYTEHILVPVPFKQRLERIAQKVNQERRRKKMGPKLPLGWFVVTHLERWLADSEAELSQNPTE